MVSFALSLCIVCVWVLTGHWLLMDAMGMGLCVAFIAFVRLPSLKVSTLLLTGEWHQALERARRKRLHPQRKNEDFESCIAKIFASTYSCAVSGSVTLFSFLPPSGLLIYDVFWVFFSSYIFNANVMVKVATRPADNPVGALSRKLHITAQNEGPKLSLPGKLVFPSVHQQGHFSMLGLGDIVMPGKRTTSGCNIASIDLQPVPALLLFAPSLLVFQVCSCASFSATMPTRKHSC